jgi:hypothetical protein
MPVDMIKRKTSVPADVLLWKQALGRDVVSSVIPLLSGKQRSHMWMTR